MFDAVVLAGGQARRLSGAAKPQLAVDGHTLLDRVVAAVHDARRIVVVGPRQPVAGQVVWCRERPPGGGPVAALAAGLPETRADEIVVLAADLPWIAPAVPELLAALAGHGVALLVDSAGRPNYLAAAWRRSELAAALHRVGPPAGAAMRGLLDGVARADVADQGGWGQDCDTWDDLASARTHREDG